MRLPDPERSRVVLIGTSSYEDDKLPDLPAVGRGIEDLKAALTDSDYGLVPESHCDVLEDEGDIRLIGRRLTRAASQAEDLLLVYFSGHGLTAGRRHELYLALRDTEWEAPEFNALEYDKLRSAVLNSPAATKMIILDCCFSGRVFGDSMADPATELIGQAEVDGTYVLASANRDQVSLSLPGEDHTAFTGRLLQLLDEGVPGGPQLLTIDNIYQQLRAQMQAEGLPQPHKRGTDNANLLALARNRAFAATAAPLLSQQQRAGGRSFLMTIVAQDPSVGGEYGMLRASVPVPADRLEPGPRSHRFQVIDYDATARVLLPAATLAPGTWQSPGSGGAEHDPFSGRSDTALLSDPAFHAQNTYAIAARTLAVFESAIGRGLNWGFPGHELYLVPHAMAEANAYYADDVRAVLFGYMPAKVRRAKRNGPGLRIARSGRLDPDAIYTCLSHDVIAHETTHAVLDGLRPRFLMPGLPDQPAFHEGLANIVALLSVFSMPEVVRSLLDHAERQMDVVRLRTTHCSRLPSRSDQP